MFDPQGLVFMANPVARSILGLPEHLNSLTAQRVFETFQTKLPDRLKSLDSEKGEPFDLIRESPKQLVLEIRINTIYSPKKERFGYLALFRDVTMERKADTAMHRFVSLISHKLRTPLVTIRAYPRLLLSEGTGNPLNDFQKNALEVIQKQCRMMEDMVNQLIAFSSLDPEELLTQRMSFADLMSEALKHMPDDLKDKLPQVKGGTELSQLYVQADPTLMQHAVRNVIENAFKFGATSLEVAGRAENGSVIVSFKDNGPGIPPEDRERVFDRFYQVEKTFCGQVPGAGLGLTMVKQTVEAHGGKIWVESQVDHGAIFFVKLPTAPAHKNG